jgi:peptide-methionine (R)-S-oxide reductase
MQNIIWGLLRRTNQTNNNKLVTMSGHDFPIKKSEEEWKQSLSPEEYNVLREKGTERPRTGEYDKYYPKNGFFKCRACGNPLYSAAAKFNSGCGWPAFDKCFRNSIEIEVDNSFGMKRVEIMCGNCGGHLGHVFSGERFTDTNERHCVNSVSVRYDNGPIPDGLEEAALDV